jgi:hypothetical protein
VLVIVVEAHTGEDEEEKEDEGVKSQLESYTYDYE